ncbi:MAG: aquaporin Z [Thermoplasmata archaeon]
MRHGTGTGGERLENSDVRKYAAELVGTFALVFIGCGSAVIAGRYIGFLGISLAFGLAVAAMVYAIGSVSGCHINPAVTAAMLVARRIGARDALVYILVQCVGAVLASVVLFYIASGLPSYNLALNGLGQNGYGSHSPAGYSMWAGFAAELVLTFLFLMVVLGSTSKRAPGGFAGLAIGLSLVFIHLVGIPVTGTSVNPARSLGPALVAGGDALTQLWLFWVAPLTGALLAALVWMLVFEEGGRKEA